MQKRVTKIEYLCDICGKPANGNFWLEEHTNDDISGEYTCPFDLCQDHMHDFSMFIWSLNENPFKTMLNERYEPLSNKQKQILLTKFKNYLEIDHD